MNAIEQFFYKYIPFKKRKRIAIRAGVKDGTILLWEQKKVKPTGKLIFYVAKAISIETSIEFEVIAMDFYKAIKATHGEK